MAVVKLTEVVAYFMSDVDVNDCLNPQVTFFIGRGLIDRGRGLFHLDNADVSDCLNPQQTQSSNARMVMLRCDYKSQPNHLVTSIAQT